MYASSIHVKTDLIVVIFVVFVDEFQSYIGFFNFVYRQTDKQTNSQTDKQNDSVVYRVAPQLKITRRTTGAKSNYFLQVFTSIIDCVSYSKYHIASII